MIKLKILMLNHSVKFDAALTMSAISKPKGDHRFQLSPEDISLLQESIPLSTPVKSAMKDVRGPDKVAGGEANCFGAWLGGASLECSS